MSDKIDPSHEYSSKEFQRKLFDWFDKRGLLSELRAFMRHRMISALYSSESPCPASHLSNLTAVSPTLQAFLLLVAEFLVQQEFHYTMSVMVAEAPLLASFPKFSGYVSYMSQTDASATMKGNNFPRYSSKDVLEILEVLGMTSDSESVEHILRLYSNNNARESLLACVLTALSAIAQNSSQETSKQNISTKNGQRNSTVSVTQWIEEIRLVLLRAQLTSHQLQLVEDLLRKLQSDTANRARQEENERNSKLNHIYEQELLAEAIIREEKFRAQIQEAEEDLRSKQKHLEQVTIQLQQQHDEVLNRLNRVQKHSDEMKRQENELTVREKALEKRQALLEDEHQILVGLRAELQEATQSLRQENSGTKTILELNRLQERCLHLESELKETKNYLIASSVHRTEMGVQATDFLPKSHEMPVAEHKEKQVSSGSSICSSMEKPCDIKERSSQVSLLKRVVCRVQQENSELRAIAAQQRKRIDELTARASQLANHIVNQANAPSPSPIPQTTSGLQRSPQPPPLPPRHVRSQIGAGNPVLLTTSCDFPAASAQPSQLTGKYARRKPSKRLLQNVNLTSSFSSDESPTEEILREAKNRLRKLEQESEAVDRCYRDFQARQADSIGASVPFTLPPKAPTLALDGTTPFSQMPTTASWQQVSPISISHQGHPTTSASGSLRFAPKILPGLSTGTPTIPKSHFSPLFPNRSTYSIPRGDKVPRLPVSYSSLPSRSSVLRRPIDRLKNLLGSYSMYSRESFGDDREKSEDHNRVILTSPLKSPGSLLNKETTTSMCEQVEYFAKMSEKSSKGTGASPHCPDTMALQGSQEINQPSANWDSRERETVEVKNQLENIDLVSVHKEKIKGINTEDQVSKEKHQPSENETKGKGSNVRDRHRNTSQSPNHQEKNAESSGMVPNHDLVEQIPSEAKLSFTEEQPDVMVSIIDCLSTAGPPIQPSVDPLSPDKHALKTSTFDATLNEISTLSSSPALSSVHATSVKVKATTESYLADLQGNTKAEKSHSLSSLIDDKQDNKDRETEVHESDDGKSLRNVSEQSMPGRASQLLHTSLSSIEISDLHVSAGSGGKKTDEDDDFW